MKKIISLIIAILMMATLLCAAIPASAAESTADCIIYFNGVSYDEWPFAEAADIVANKALGVGNYKIQLLKNVELTTTFNPKHASNVEIDGLLPDGSKAIVNSTVTKNNWRLEGGAKYVKEGGVLVYSTCTVLPEENEQNVQRFLCDHREFYPEDFSVGTRRSRGGLMSLSPDKDGTDGFFIAKMRRVASK